MLLLLEYLALGAHQNLHCGFDTVEVKLAPVVIFDSHKSAPPFPPYKGCRLVSIVSGENQE